jgi:3'-phosphoadenosine 5'-phosphosulfate sulfotransferase (PAPS reductase)/FAD synthetase
LKIRIMRDYARSLGWEHWTNAIGLRHDEARRVAKIRNDRERWETVAPLYDAGVTREDVAAFWKAQDFDLGLPDVGGKTPAGNCDLCFLKSAGTISALIRSDPSLADWWIRMEEEARPSKPLAGFFRKDRPSYRKIRDAVLDQRDMDFGERDALTECYCHE